jgi:myo-inositol-1(or 4)-monophosphatase
LPAPDHADLALLEDAARAAGEIALAGAGRPGEIRDKPGGLGPVSEIDLAVDAMLRARLLGARPGYGWLSEETEDGPERQGARRLFVVDPIDGTRAFLAGQKAWSHSLAVVEDGRVIAGVIHLPMLGKTYAATRGNGARLNGSPISVASRTRLEGARLLASAGQLAAWFGAGSVPPVERLFRPSIAYRLCLVADGTADAMLNPRETWEWDIAAGALIAAEAGAAVTDARGGDLVFNRPRPAVDGILAGVPAVRAALAERAHVRSSGA